jgi:hypothetical protein
MITVLEVVTGIIWASVVHRLTEAWIDRHR